MVLQKTIEAREDFLSNKRLIGLEKMDTYDHKSQFFSEIRLHLSKLISFWKYRHKEVLNPNEWMSTIRALLLYKRQFTLFWMLKNLEQNSQKPHMDTIHTFYHLAYEINC